VFESVRPALEGRSARTRARIRATGVSAARALSARQKKNADSTHTRRHSEKSPRVSPVRSRGMTRMRGSPRQISRSASAKRETRLCTPRCFDSAIISLRSTPLLREQRNDTGSLAWINARRHPKANHEWMRVSTADGGRIGAYLAPLSSAISAERAPIVCTVGTSRDRQRPIVISHRVAPRPRKETIRRTWKVPPTRLYGLARVICTIMTRNNGADKKRICPASNRRHARVIADDAAAPHCVLDTASRKLRIEDRD